MLELLINIDAWNSLPRHLQVIIETATNAVNQDTLDEYLARNNQALTEVYDSYSKFKNDVTEYHKISEDAFIESRNK